MPYITKEDRSKLDAAIATLAERIREISAPETRAGNLNYSITRMLKMVYGAKLRYADHNEIVGMLDCAKQEWYRRCTAPYEDEKITANGDV